MSPWVLGRGNSGLFAFCLFTFAVYIGVPSLRPNCQRHHPCDLSFLTRLRDASAFPRIFHRRPANILMYSVCMYFSLVFSVSLCLCFYFLLIFCYFANISYIQVQYRARQSTPDMRQSADDGKDEF